MLRLAEKATMQMHKGTFARLLMMPFQVGVAVAGGVNMRTTTVECLLQSYQDTRRRGGGAIVSRGRVCFGCGRAAARCGPAPLAVWRSFLGRCPTTTAAEPRVGSWGLGLCAAAVERRPDAEKRLYGDRSLPLIVTFISSIGSLDKALKLRSEIAPRPEPKTAPMAARSAR